MKFLPLVFSILCMPLVADVQPGISSAHVEFSTAASLGSMSDTDSASATGIQRVRLKRGLNLSDTLAPDSRLDGHGSADLKNQHSVFNPDPGFLQVIGSGSSSVLLVNLTGTYTPDPLLVPAGSTTSSGPGNENIHEFSISSSPLPVSLTGSFSGTAGTGVVTLERNDPLLGWQTVFLSQAPDPPFEFTGTLQPGDYRMRGSISVTTTGPVTAASHTYILEVGTAPTTPYVPPAGEYTHPDVGTDFTDSPSLTATNATILSQASIGGGFTQVGISADLTNSSDCPWSEVALGIPTTFPGGPDITVTSQEGETIAFDDIPSNATASSTSSGSFFTVVVPDGGLNTFLASILDGSRFTTHGRELWVFTYPVEVIDNDWARDLSDSIAGIASSSLTFFEDPGFQPGTYYIEHEEFSRIEPISQNLPGGALDPVTGGLLSQGFDRYLPILVTGVDILMDPFGETQYRVFFEQPTFLETVKHGTVRSTVDLTHPSGLTVTEGTSGPVVPKPQPIHFNRVDIANVIELSGSLLLVPGPIGVEFTMKNGLPETFLVTAGLRADTTLLVETRGAADNTGDPVASQEKELFRFPLFSLVLPAGFTLTPEFSMDVGAAVNAPTGLSVPIESSMELDITFGMKNGAPFYDHQIVKSDPALSLPAIHQQLQASAQAWAGAELLFRIGLPGSGGGLGVGPTVGVEVAGNFLLNPTGDPWWALGSELKLNAGLEFDLAGFVTLVDQEQTLETLPLPGIDAGGPLFPPFAARNITLPDNPGIRPIAGKETRWARILQTTNGTSFGDKTNSIFRLTGSSDILVQGGNDISCYSAEGALLWSRFMSDPRRSVPTPDGGFALMTIARNELHRFDGAGNLIWAKGDLYSGPGSFVLNDLAVRTNGSGQPEYFTCGFQRTSFDNTQVVLIKHASDGTVLWSKFYAPNPVGGELSPTEVNRVITTADGNVVLVGSTAADIASGSPAGPSPVATSNNGIAMKIDGDTGAVMWTTLIAIDGNFEYSAIAEGPDGSIYLGGGRPPALFNNTPSLMVTKLHPDGSLLDSVLIGSASSQYAQAVGYPIDPVPHGGENAYDHILSMAWADNHLWIAGNIGAPGNSIATDGQSGFTARLTPDLGVTRFAIHAGPNADLIGAVADGGDGLLVSGSSRSFLPWPTGATSEASATPNARLVMKLPWEGLLRFHDLSAGRQDLTSDPAPNAGSYYVSPRVIAASDTTIFSARYPSGSPDPDAPDQKIAADTVPITVTDFTLSSNFGSALASFPIVPLDHHQIEFVPSEIVDDFASYIGYHQIDPDSDSDEDGMNEAAEFFHGTDPFTADTVIPNLSLSGGQATLTVPRSNTAAALGLEPNIQDSPDLLQWFNRTDATLGSSPLDPARELLEIALPLDPLHDRRFFRIAAPAP